ncbi:MAG: UDP-3-O-(3-hydroxymyristoyl)glucosamine N-acyltransferase [Rhodanobacteraceae bacterium]|nr:UDP-3-O-(3-hydroxymyristoyl)glucosamine N-acyltransferase [Rhodanobacteraceae bacterium]MBL0041900.1 UDP-3-O-(3-hydroxymyristoyl)glucosamine N-acyltransferase [Xanthomonadales bacterium]MBP6078337.1 UDP-3-O-(3-hydroxymyristoyl)glucosamine N-acyltransferase [Xanthomonadales bacterium]MBP7625071.1 UDP-3-O-(3-hydroxymyristoyl)glucosamine N-acyltransferase [Xanthomonadales bacterium]
MYALADIANRFGLELRGDATAGIVGVNTLAEAGPDQIGFLANPAYRAQLATTRAAAVVLSDKDAHAATGSVLVSRNPYADFARITALFERREPVTPGIHPSAVVAGDAVIDPNAQVAAHCVIGARSRIAAGAVLGPACVIGEDCVIGPEARLVARVTLVVRVRIGARVLIHPGAVLGADGFGLAFDQGAWLKVPQLGGVVVGDDCEIGANTTIDRGALGDTVLEEDVRLDNQIQIGHNVRIGAHTAIAGCAAIAGSTRVGRHCLIAGGAGIIGHLDIADRVTVGAMSLVTHDLREPGEYVSGTPIQPKREWRRNAARFGQLDQLARRVRKLLGEGNDE